MANNRKQDVEQSVADVDFDKHRYQIELNTSQGTIRLDLDPEAAPGHCRNMLGLARTGFYDGTIFHRVLQGFMIQCGCPEGTGFGGPGYTIEAEFNATPHEEGVLSMARSQDPNSAGSQFFICLDRHPHLDNQYTAFGKTADVESLAVVKSIGSAPTGSDDRPRETVTIEAVQVVEAAK